ncbi:hypothetical protein ACFV20_19425 [Streptomyces sp. NPDC059696]|uniref:hypothetical protein n=1 Tax=Streptomyces sp. NPDC059696 TaxID=3346911 RepID=UPI0036CB0DA9
MTSKPLTQQQLNEYEARAAAYAKGHTHLTVLCGPACDMATAVPTLIAEIRRQRDELAELKAANDPRLRCLIVKPHRDKDQYVGWSNVCDMPAGVWSRETAIEYGFPPSRLDRADETGSSSRIGDGAWDDKGFVAEQRGWLKRERLGDYAVEYLTGDREAAYALLEPFEDEAPEEASR